MPVGVCTLAANDGVPPNRPRPWNGNGNGNGNDVDVDRHEALEATKKGLCCDAALAKEGELDAGEAIELSAPPQSRPEPVRCHGSRDIRDASSFLD